MVTRSPERKKEPEPRELSYDRTTRLQNEAVRRRVGGKVIVRGKDRDWEQSRQGLLKHILDPTDWDAVGTPGWAIFVQSIKEHSGRHTHQGGLVIFVLEGTGYTVVDGVRYDWQAGDLIVLPIKPGGCEHQHFNTADQQPATWVAFSFRTMLEVVSVGRTQQAEHPDWLAGKTK